jgi:hypothetical protein
VEDLLSRLASHDAAAIVFFVLVFLAGMVVWLSLQWRLHRRTELEAALKQDMLSRGMSAAEIERVLRAPLSGSCGSADEADDLAPRGTTTA